MSESSHDKEPMLWRLAEGLVTTLLLAAALMIGLITVAAECIRGWIRNDP